MIYVLIFVWQAYGGSAPSSALAVEFNDMPSCQAAASELRRQAGLDRSAKVQMVMCAAKGKGGHQNG